MYNLEKVMFDCMNKLDNLNIKYGNIVKIYPNTRAKKRYGQCTIVNGGFEIDINIGLLDEKEPIQALENTVLHELLHTVDGCFNHGEKWQSMASKVNKAYRYNIKRCSTSAEKGVSANVCYSKETYHYIITCESCNSTWKYKRHCSIVNSCQTNKARCSCGGKTFNVIHI